MFSTEIITNETDLHHVHGVVEKFFPNQHKQYCVSGRVVFVRSEKECTSDYKSYAFDDSVYNNGSVVGFSVYLNPIKKLTSGKTVPLMGVEEKAYIEKRLKEVGVEAIKMEVITLGVRWVNKPNNRFPINTCEAKGIFEVKDEVKFRRALSNGITGRCKAYGYGMINILD